MEQHEDIGVGGAYFRARRAALAAGSLADNTARAYSRMVDAFRRWAVENNHSLATDGAKADAAMLYLEARCEGDVGGMRAFSARSLAVAYSALVNKEILPPLSGAERRGLRNKIVERERRGGGRAVERARALGLGEVLRMSEKLLAVGEGAAAARNAAMVLLGFMGMMRPDELLGLQVGDIERTDDMVVVHYRRRKNGEDFTAHLLPKPEQMKAGFAALNSALRLWCGFRRGMPGAAFFCRCHAPAGKAIASHHILNDILQAHAENADGVSGYSLRRGGVQERLKWQTPSAVMRVGGWRNTEAFGAYGFAE